MRTDTYTDIRFLLMLAGAIVLLLLAASPARADTFITGFAGATFGHDAPSAEPIYGAAIDQMFGVIGIEGEIGYSPNLFGDNSHVLTLMGNILAGKSTGMVRPYAVGGVGLIQRRSSLSIPGVIQNITYSNFAFNAGGGARVILGAHLSVRGDLRYFQAHDSGLSFWRGYGGVSFGW